MELDRILALLIAFGLGSIISVVVQSWLNARSDNRRQIFSENREVYIGLLKKKCAKISMSQLTKKACFDA